MFQQKVRKRVVVHGSAQELAIEGARDTAILVGKQAEQLAVIQQAQEFPGSAGIDTVGATVNRPDFTVQNAVEPSRPYRNIACHERDAEAAEPRAYRLVVPEMRRQEEASPAHFFEDRSRTFRKAKIQTVQRAGVCGSIGRQLLESIETEQQLAGMLREVFDEIAIKNPGFRFAGPQKRNSRRNMTQIRIHDRTFPPHKAEQKARTS